VKLYTHLNFGGNCEEAFRFYETHLGGRITMMMRQGDMPTGPQGDPKAIAHARMDLGDTVLIGNDVPPAHFQKMRSVYLYLAMDSTQEVERIYALLTEGGEVYMPLEKTFFASRFGMVRDQFGVSWTLLHEQPR
jgi:PhnB protein